MLRQWEQAVQGWSLRWGASGGGPLCTQPLSSPPLRLSACVRNAPTHWSPGTSSTTPALSCLWAFTYVLLSGRVFTLAFTRLAHSLSSSLWPVFMGHHLRSFSNSSTMFFSLNNMLFFCLYWVKFISVFVCSFIPYLPLPLASDSYTPC